MNKSGVVLRFTRDSGLISRLIRVATRSEWSHVDIVLEDLSFIGAYPGRGVVNYKEPAEEYQWCLVPVPSEEIANQVRELAKHQVGKSYDWAAVFSLPFRGDWENKRKWFCSELIAYAFEAAGVPLFRERPFRITARDIYILPQLIVL